MKEWIQIGGITLGCLAVYFGLRWLPVESCAFLHYGEFVDANGVIEGCGYEETEFFDLTKLRFPILVELSADATPVAGSNTSFMLSLQTTTGRPIRYEDIAVTHTERLHALIIDESLQDYQHIHPRPAGPPGHYVFEMTPKMSGEYRVYLDFIPLINNRRTLLWSRFEVHEDSGEMAADPESAVGTVAEGFDLQFNPANPRSGEEIQMELVWRGVDGVAPPVFDPVMGAFAHLVTFDAAGRGFVHLHPLNPIIHGQDPYSPDLRFTMKLDQPGHYRIWAQIIVNGEELFLPFDLHLDS